MSTAFPTLRILADRLEPRGSFAEAQAEYLTPDPQVVGALDDLLRDRNVGVTAHFYMDAELQGVLTACQWPHVQISDSLAMADRAVRMAEEGVKAVVVLGVDFMSENVRAALDAAGHTEVDVLRVAREPIGCSLAESAETPGYMAWLDEAARTPKSLHVIYINTSLRTKALAHARVPTITCTSSNVVRTVLQAAHQVPDVRLWYGPDTYMGQNLRQLFEGLATMPADAVASVHPEHTPDTVRRLLDGFSFYTQGVCIVHHMFGADVAARVRADYDDAFVTAHLEVPGEMFTLGFEAQQRGAGVVGSTSDILRFIDERVSTAAASGSLHPRFVLGTEAGMVTSIVRRVQERLRTEGSDASAEIVFPVASEAVAATDDLGLGVVPGVAAGEGCTVAGGCATCPFMKMNSLDALRDLLDVLAGDADLASYRPRSYPEPIEGRAVADLGGEPIAHMRHFQGQGRLPDALIQQIVGPVK